MIKMVANTTIVITLKMYQMTTSYALSLQMLYANYFSIEKIIRTKMGPYGHFHLQRDNAITKKNLRY